MAYLDKSGLQVDAQLAAFVENEALAGTGIAADAYWAGLAGLVDRFMPRNRELLAFRDELQGKIDQWNREHGAASSDPGPRRGCHARRIRQYYDHRNGNRPAGMAKTFKILRQQSSPRNDPMIFRAVASPSLRRRLAPSSPPHPAHP